VTDPVKQSDAGLIAGATIVATIFMLIVALVIYMCCCRCKQKDYPRKNSTYQMYSEVDASQMVVRYLCKQTLENTEGAIKKGQSSPASDCFTGSVTPGEFPGMTVLAVMDASPRKEQWRAMIFG
jgi:hypothetical protein